MEKQQDLCFLGESQWCEIDNLRVWPGVNEHCAAHSINLVEMRSCGIANWQGFVAIFSSASLAILSEL